MSRYYVFDTEYFFRLLRFTARLFYSFSVFEQTRCNSSQTFGKKFLNVSKHNTCSSTFCFNFVKLLLLRAK
jgi:hypothetical protein